MIVQTVLCRSWQQHITDAFRHFRSSHSLVLHHTRRPLPTTTRHVLLRSFRSSARCHTPPKSLQATPFDNYSFGGSVPPGNVWKALVFTGAFGVGCFASATILEYENARSMMLSRARQTKFPWFRNQSNYTGSSRGVFHDIKRELHRYWEQLSPGEKVFAPILALNLIVFGLWRVPSLRNTMMTYFCSNPAARAVCWPMFLSTFSHYSAFHIFANMYVLHSFANAAVVALGKEQFLAVYLSAGVLASMSSIAYKALTAQAGLSIGASGAIMAILAYVCAHYPDTQLSILFLPMITFSAGTAIKVIMSVDLAGCLMGWKFFDHAAHLGGALFGLFYAFYGTEVWQQRIPLLNLYHDWRKTK